MIEVYQIMTIYDTKLQNLLINPTYKQYEQEQTILQ